MYPCAIFPQRPGEQSGRSGHLRRFSRILAAGLAVLAFASAAPCLAQTELVSNMSETNTADGARVYSSGGQATFIAQEFTTGSNADGYLLSEVVVNVIVDDPVHYNPGTPVFTLHESTPHTNGDPIPGAKIADLTGSVATAGEQAFTVSGDPIPLAANTLYFLYFESESGDIQLQSTTSDNETSDSGWKLGKTLNYVKFSGFELWQTMPEFNVIKVTIKGSVGGGIRTQAKTPPPPPPQAPDAPEVTLSGLGTIGSQRTASHQSRTDSTTTGLDVRWTEPENTHCPGTCPEITHYELQYRRGTSSDWTDWPGLVEGTAVTIDMPDLTGAWEVRVRAVNAAGRKGAWSEPGFWAPSPDAPVVIRTEGGTTSLDVRWRALDATNCRDCPAVTHYELQYRQGAAGPWTDRPGMVEGTAVTIDIPDLMGSYQVRVRAVHGDGQVGAWSEPGFWAPSPDAPVVIRTEGGTTGLDVRWRTLDEMSCRDCPAVTHHDLQYRRHTDGSWETWADGPRGVTGTAATVTVPDLLSSYQVRVRAVHGHGREGAWSEPGQWSPPPELAGSRLMKAWLSRFGRTVADQVIDAVTGRLEEPADGAGLEARIAGLDPGTARTPTFDPDGQYSQYGPDREDEFTGAAEDGIPTRGIHGVDILRSSAFGYSSGDAKTGMASVFGRGAVTGFDGRDGDVDVDGTVRSLMLGTDFRRADTVFGALLAHSSGKGDYREGTEEEGKIRSTLTGLYPYAGHETDHLSLWGIAGFGRGEVTVYQDKSPYRTGASVTTDMDLLMAAGGIRSELMEPAPEDSAIPSVDAVADVMAVRVSSDGAGERLAAAEADVARLRAGLEGAWAAVEAGGGLVTPSMRIGIRADGGDADRGFGADYEGRLDWSDPAHGFRVQLRLHGLLAHEAEGFRERGVSGSLSWDPAPGSNRGAAFSLTHSIVDTASWDLDSLLYGPGDRDAVARLGGEDDTARDRRERVRAKIGYGFPRVRGTVHGNPGTRHGLIGRGPGLQCRLAPAEGGIGCGCIRDAAGGDAPGGLGRRN